MARLHCVVLLLFISLAVYAEDAHFTPCGGVSPDLCTVSAVRIDPCKKGKNKCIVNTNIDATLSFDFTPNFTASKLKTKPYYNDSPFSDLTNDDACGFTTCPTVPGTQQTLNYTLHLGKKLPLGSYTFNWKVWDEENPAQLCCFATTIQLRKAK